MADISGLHNYNNTYMSQTLPPSYEQVEKEKALSKDSSSMKSVAAKVASIEIDTDWCLLEVEESEGQTQKVVYMESLGHDLRFMDLLTTFKLSSASTGEEIDDYVHKTTGVEDLTTRHGK